MTKNEANIHIAVMLATIGEAEAGMFRGQPSGPLYALMSARIDLDDYQMLLGILKGGGLVTEQGHLLNLTPKGREMHVKIAAIISEEAARRAG